MGPIRRLFEPRLAEFEIDPERATFRKYLRGEVKWIPFASITAVKGYYALRAGPRLAVYTGNDIEFILEIADIRDDLREPFFQAVAELDLDEDGKRALTNFFSQFQ